MNPEILWSRLALEMKKFARNNKISQKVRLCIFKTLQKDRILPELNLRKNCKIRFFIECNNAELPDTICLSVGPRDWQWDFSTGELLGSGCCIG
jgi:hypothetical protein